MVAYIIKYMEMPKNCWNCKCSNFCSHFREHGCLFNGDRPSGCPLLEIGICKDCSHYDPLTCNSGTCLNPNMQWSNEVLATHYCADFEKRGSEK